ncbi:phosphotransferase [Photobacterium profundum]|uniref:phosphotransferase n=1 Tax=Photobacterium profundum TaxID=74109 RepID=UPI003D110BDD
MESFDQSVLRALSDVEFVTARPLSGGLSNRCWLLELRHHTPQHKPDSSLRSTSQLVSSTTRQYVWRPNAASSRVFGVSRQHEFQILSLIQSQHVAPAPYRLLESGLLVEWVTGQVVEEEQAAPSDNTKQRPLLSDVDLMALQARVHRLPVPTWRLDVKSRIEHYWQFIPEHIKTPLLQSVYANFQHKALPVGFADTCCHHDLGRYNIIQTEDGGYKIIDWEYAAAGDPSLDLALTINANGLDPIIAVNAYCSALQITGTQAWHQAVALWQPWCEFLALLWFLVGAELWQDDTYTEQALQLLVTLTDK